MRLRTDKQPGTQERTMHVYRLDCFQLGFNCFLLPKQEVEVTLLLC